MEKGRDLSGGFTIVETLIVLAVTSTLLVSALLLLSGRDSRIRFELEVNKLSGDMEQIINETEQGYYNNNKSFDCVAAGAPLTPTVTASASGNDQGTNVGCSLIGKIIRFNAANTYDLRPMTGLQYDATKNPITTLAASRPTLVSVASTVETTRLASYVRVTPATDIKASDALPVISFGFLYGDAQGNIAGSSGGKISSGSQQYSLYAISGTNSALAMIVYNGGPAKYARHVKSVTVCVRGGSGASRSALITISDSGGLNVTKQFKGTLDCS